MTDDELLKAGERLYNSFVQSPFSFLELAGLAAARERRTPWSQLGPRLKFAVFRLVVGPEPESPATAGGDEPPASAVSAPPVAMPPSATSAPAASAAPETSAGQQDPMPSSTAAPGVAEAIATPAPASVADPTQPAAAPDPADSGEEADDDGDHRV